MLRDVVQRPPSSMIGSVAAEEKAGGSRRVMEEERDRHEKWKMRGEREKKRKKTFVFSRARALPLPSARPDAITSV